jgi:hypothetical protein
MYNSSLVCEFYLEITANVIKGTEFSGLSEARSIDDWMIGNLRQFPSCIFIAPSEVLYELT